MEEVEPMYYLQCLEKSYKRYAFWLTGVSIDVALFNTLYVKNAKKFTRSEALIMCADSKYAAFPCSIVESLVNDEFKAIYNEQLHQPILNKNQNK